MNYKLEICCDTVKSAVDAMNSGADRVELCDNLAEGGTTPSYGAIAAARDSLKTGLHVLIRPRGGDFLYDETEYDIMLRDIGICKKLGVDGIVAGILNPDGSVDKKRTSALVKAAHPLPVTFHRAFDMSNDPFRALEDVIACGATRLLTSGQRNKAAEGAGLIGELIRLAGDRLIIMPGSGLTDSGIEATARLTGAKEFHLTGRKTVESRMAFRRDTINMGGIPGIPEYSRKVADPVLISRIRNILDNI